MTVHSILKSIDQTEGAAIAFLNSLDVSAMKLGLDRIRAVLETLGNPQDALSIVHIAGTNGKGSTTAMLSNVLKVAGFKTGRFISPHLVSVRERIAINGQPISAEDFAEEVFALKRHLEALDWPRDEWPTYFEYLNVVAYQYFVAQKVDLCVFETGLGGRLDSTNVVTHPRLTVITSIGLDHTKHLGETLAEIAFEKAGILKEAVPLILGPNLPEEAYAVIHERAESLSIRVIDVYSDSLTVESGLSTAKDGLILRQVDTGDSFRLSLSPPYQRDNAAIVLTCIEQLQEQGFFIPLGAIGEGLATTYWPARFQTIAEENLLLDGSHNADGFAALANALRLYYPAQPFFWLLSLRNNRPVEVLADLLKQFSKPLEVIVTAGQPMHLYHAPESLAQQLQETLGDAQTVHVIADPTEALNTMKKLREKSTHPDALGIITGSLYTAGAILEALGLDESSRLEQNHSH